MKKIFIYFIALTGCVQLLHAQSNQIHFLEENTRSIGVSRNGQYVVGLRLSAGTSFIWTDEDGFSNLTNNPDYNTVDRVSDNGIVVGRFTDRNYPYEYVNDDGELVQTYLYSAGYVKDGEWHSLGIQLDPDIVEDGIGSLAHDISSDGTVIAGGMYIDLDTPAPTVWIEKENTYEYQNLDQQYLPALAFVSSSDGTIKSGWASPLSGQRQPVVWKEDNSAEIITYKGIRYAGEASAVSPDGKYVALNFQNNLALYNVEEGKATILPINIEDIQTVEVTGISDNGIIIGNYYSNDFYRGAIPFIYTEQIGFIPLDEYIKNFDIDVPSNYVFNNAGSISADGKRIVGYVQSGYDPIGYILDINEHLTGYNPAKNLAISAISNNSITLNWDKSTVDSNNTFIGYNIYRNGEKLNSNPITDLSYIDNDLSKGSYTYYVTAVWNDNDESLPTNRIKRNLGTVSLPFFESFDSGSLDTHYWNPELTELTRWNVDMNTGLFEPNVKFVVPVGGNYSESLISPYIDINDAEKVYISYNYFQPFASNTGKDRMKVEVYDGTAWNTVKDYGSSSDYNEFQYAKHDISQYIAGGKIQIRFTAYGENMGDEIAWQLDNIRVYSEEDEIVITAPLHIEAELMENGNVFLSWTDANETATLSYLEYEFVVDDAVGNAGKPIILANKFDALDSYDGFQLTSISAYITTRTPENPPVLRLAVFVGEQRVNEENIEDYTLNAWNTFTLSSPVTIDANKPLYFGIELVEHNVDDRVIDLCFTDINATSSLNGRSNIFSEDDGITWISLFDEMESAASFALKAEVKKEKSLSPQFGILGYKLYRDGGDIVEYDFITVLNNYIDINVPNKEEVCYEVVAYYITQQYSEKSASACVKLSTTDLEDIIIKDDILVYPNPFDTYLIIEGEFQKAELLNIEGQSVLSTSAKVIDTSSLPKGIYVLKLIKENNQSVVKKLIKQ